MRISAASVAWSWGLLAGAAQAQILVTELSFGFGSRISPDHNAKTVPYFELQGSPNQPEVLSNKVILTPGAPAPGNQRGAVWSHRTIDDASWMTDVDFRVSGPERGGGNVNIWFVKDGPAVVGTSSVYTVGQFEGLALVLDTSRTRAAGTLRGYLNDGTKDFKALSGVDNQAFAQCDYAYRNLGRPSQIKVHQTDRLFSVEIDGNPCFSSEHVVIPTGYRVGVTAASADVPDSAEVFKIVVMREADTKQQQNSQNQQQQQQQQQQNSPYDQDEIPDADASTITSSAKQFADLHYRVQSLGHHLSAISRQVSTMDQTAEKRHEELSGQLGQMGSQMASQAGGSQAGDGQMSGKVSQLADQLSGVLAKLNKLERLDRLDRLEVLETKLDKMAQDLRAVKGELRSAMSAAENAIKNQVSGHLDNHHERLAEALKPPGHGRLILVIVLGQVLLAGTYLVYKRRKASSPKKYL